MPELAPEAAALRAALAAPASGAFVSRLRPQLGPFESRQAQNAGQLQALVQAFVVPVALAALALRGPRVARATAGCAASGRPGSGPGC